jgi:hypothetical protein
MSVYLSYVDCHVYMAKHRRDPLPVRVARWRPRRWSRLVLRMGGAR